MCNDDEDDDDDDDEDDEDDEDEDDDYDDDHHHDFDYDRKVNVCWFIGMPVYASQRFSSQKNSWIFAEPTILQIRLHARCKLLVSDNILSTNLRPRQRSDVPSKYSLVKRPRLSRIAGSSLCACTHLRKHSTTGCILVKTCRGIEYWQSMESEFDYDTSPEST